MASSNGANDWREVYRDMNQVSDRMRFDQLEPSEVMVIHRMYIKMSELDVGHLAGAEKVTHLYVFADVVEYDPGSERSARLPGSISVVIMCREWHVSCYLSVSSDMRYTFDRGVNVCLPHMSWHLNLESGGMHRVDPVTLQSFPEPCFCVYADDISFACYNPDGGSWDPRVQFPSAADLARRAFLRNLNIDPLPNHILVTLSRDPPRWGAHLELDFAYRDNMDVMEEITSLPPGTRVLLKREGLSIPVLVRSTQFMTSTTLTDANFLAPALSILRRGAEFPVELLGDPNILPAIQTSILIGELVEVGNPSAAIIEALQKHVKWLDNLLHQVIEENKGKDVEEYIELSFRAQYVIKRVGRIRSLVVPQLQYDVYSNLINRMAQVAESYDQALRQFMLFIQTNKILGGFLLEQNRAFAEKERDMDVFYSEIITQRQIELDNTLQKLKRLSIQMEAEQADMEQAQADMEAGLREFQNRQVARALFAVLGAIAAVGLTFLTGGAAAPLAMGAARTAVTVAGSLARGLQRVLDVLEGLQAVMEVVAVIKELFDALKDLGQAVELPEMAEMPLPSDWLIFVNEVEAVAEEMPTEVSEVVAWKTKCKNVAVLGQEMMTTAAYISQLQYDIMVQDMLQQIARKQADRLSAIQLPDLKNFTEMVTQMDMRTTRLLVALIKVMYIQNAALMYQYLSAPMAVSAWPVNMDTVWRMLVQHEQLAIQGLLRLGPAFDIVRTYVVEGIPVSLLLDGDDYEFELPVADHVTFPLSLSRVRIHHLEMKFVQGTNVHVPVTDTGGIYILLQGSRNFHDRSEGEFFHYEAATSLDYHYAYRLETGETTVSNLPSAEFVKTFMRMTPFTNWRLRLSASAEENKGLAFPTATSADATTQIAITFYISAIRQIDL